MSETIGTCEICGATDHHLVEGLCPGCQPKTITIVAGGRQCGKTFIAEQAERIDQFLRSLPDVPKHFDCDLLAPVPRYDQGGEQ